MNYRQMTESGVVKRGAGKLSKIIINSHSSGTLKIYDGTEASSRAYSTLTSAGACVPASHGQNVLTSTGALVGGGHAYTVLTISGSVSDGETITIGSIVYTAKTIPTTAYHVAIGASTEEFIQNLANAIEGEFSYGGTVAHPDVHVSANTATTLTIRANVPGTPGDGTATTETLANGSFPDTTIGGGAGASTPGTTVAAATVTIGDITYTILNSLTQVYKSRVAIPYQVLYGGSVAACLDNLKKAINGTGTAGTEYSTGTVAHPYVIATTNTDTAQTIVSRAIGDAAFTATVNALATTETLANTAWADSTFGGGTGNSNPAVTSDAATITIGDITYTAVLELSETSGATAVPYQVLWQTSEAVFLDNFKKAINASGYAGTTYSTGTYENMWVTATTNADTTQLVSSKFTGTVGNSVATTETLGNYSWTSTVLGSGSGSSGRLVSDTITLSAVATTGEREIKFGDVDLDYGLYIDITGGTANLTVVYE